MKRRNAECGKMRRPIKRNKITEGIYGSTLLYLKFLLLWAMVILADFILEFRFEFLWPFWMLMRSVYDSFKYQGLAFSVFFVCIALTSDMICFFFIPVQWVFFAASTYVWVQYVWYTDKGVCLPTMILCTVFVYMEAGVRLRDLRHMPAHLDLCRPFAAHCIGYPVVTLGFGFKSYVGYRMRQRRQREVARENTFYTQLLQQALPLHMRTLHDQPAIKESEKIVSTEKVTEISVSEKQMNGNAFHVNSSKGSHSKKSDSKCNNSGQQSDKPVTSPHHNHTGHNHISQNSHFSNHKEHLQEGSTSEVVSNSHEIKTKFNHNHITVVSNHKEKDKEKDSHSKTYSESNHSKTSQNKHVQSNGVAGSHATDKTVSSSSQRCESPPCPTNDKQTADFEKASSNLQIHADKELEVSNVASHAQFSPDIRAESEISPDKSIKSSTKTSLKWEKKESSGSALREEKRKNKNKDKEANKEKDSNDNHQKYSEQKEREKEKEKESEWAKGAERERALRSAVAAERQARAELTQLRQQNEQLNAKLNGATAVRQAERAALVNAERRLTEERRARQAADARHHRLQKSGECAEWCRQRRTALEQETSGLRNELQQSREHNQTITQQLHAAEQQVSSLEARSRENGPEAWRTTLAALSERLQHLERSLSAETRIKLDLFSAVGEAKRQLGLREGVIRAQEKEMDELKGKIAQMLAVMPSDSFVPSGGTGGGGASKLRLASFPLPLPLPLSHSHSPSSRSLSLAHPLSQQQLPRHSLSPPSPLLHGQQGVPGINLNLNSNVNSMSNLDPNATAYTPKGAPMQCGPAAEA